MYVCIYVCVCVHTIGQLVEVDSSSAMWAPGIDSSVILGDRHLFPLSLLPGPMNCFLSKYTSKVWKGSFETGVYPGVAYFPTVRTAQEREEEDLEPFCNYPGQHLKKDGGVMHLSSMCCLPDSACLGLIQK